MSVENKKKINVKNTESMYTAFSTSIESKILKQEAVGVKLLQIETTLPILFLIFIFIYLNLN